MSTTMSSTLGPALVAGLGAGDPASTRAVYSIVVALGAIGVLLVLLAFWILRQTKPDRELLAPLERMSQRSWVKQEPAERRRTLDTLRPEGAQPVAREQGVPEVDEEFTQPKPRLAGFEDLQAQRAADARRSTTTPDDATGDANDDTTGDANDDTTGDANDDTTGDADDDTGELTRDVTDEA